MVGLCLAAACSVDSLPTPEDASGTQAPVQVVKGDITSVLTVPATVAAAPEVMISSKTDGRDLRYRVRRGDVVKAGSALAQYDAVDGRKTLRAPAEVSISNLGLAPGASFTTQTPLFRVQVNAMVVRAKVEGQALYRFADVPGTARAQITNGPGPFPCSLVGDPTPDGDGFALYCLPADNVRMVNNLDAVLAIDAGTRSDVLLLPLSAVAGLADHGQVTRLVNGKTVKQDVGLGLSDGVNVEITSGLVEGETVTADPPDLSYPAPNSGR